MRDIEFATFPMDTCEALALLYVQSRDLSDKTPSEIYSIYREAYAEIKEKLAIPARIGVLNRPR